MPATISPETLALLRRIAMNPKHTATSAEILRFCENDRPVSEYRLALLREARLLEVCDYQSEPPQPESGIVFVSMGIPSYYRVTLAGLDCLAEQQRIEDENRKADAENKAHEDKRLAERIEDRRHNWRIAFFSFLTGTGLTLLVEHVLIPLLSSGH